MLTILAGLLLIAGGVSAYSRLDLERFHASRIEMDHLAGATIPSADASALAADDWPQWRGPNRNGLSPATGLLTEWPLEGPRLIWKKAIGRGFSGISVAGGRLYTMVEEAMPATGEPSAPFVNQEVILCCDAASGRELWRFFYPSRFDERFGSGPRSTPAVDDNRVYAVGPTGALHCVHADTGAIIWRHDLREEFHGREMQYGVAFSPLVEGDLVHTIPGGPDGNAVAAFDKRSGALRWKALDGPAGYSSPVAATLAGVRQVLVLLNTELVSLNPATGQVYWRYPWTTNHGFNIATPVAFGNYVFISSAYDKGCALLEVSAAADGTLLARSVYEHNRMRNYFATSVRYGEQLYGFDLTDLVCMDIRTGACRWREKGCRSFKKGSLIIADGYLVVLGESGTLALARATPAGYRESAVFQLSDQKCWTAPSLAGGRLYVRDQGNLFCLDLKAESAGSRQPMLASAPSAR
jgi:outer membrane protein assembly factor BamB